jgi:hypothetical protein
MVKTLEEILSETKKIKQKHPLLGNVKITPFSEKKINNHILSHFIENCWIADYQNEPRVTFSKEFLDFNDSILDKDCSFTLTKNDELIGCVLCYENSYFSSEFKIKIIHGTGLSVKPSKDFRGNGIAQYLVLNSMKNAVEKNYDGYTYFLDSRHRMPGKSYNIFGKKNKITSDKILSIGIYGKSFNIEKSTQIGSLNFLEKMGIQFMDKIFSLSNHLSDEYELISDLERNQFQEINYLFNSNSSEDLYLPTAEKIFNTKSNFYGEDFNSLNFTFKKDNRTIGILYGITNPVLHNEKYFQTDGLFFDKRLTKKEKRSFLRNVEYKLRNEQNCFSMIIPTSATTENLVSLGYLPIEKQLFCLAEYKPIPSNKYFIEIR